MCQAIKFIKTKNQHSYHPGSALIALLAVGSRCGLYCTAKKAMPTFFNLRTHIYLSMHADTHTRSTSWPDDNNIVKKKINKVKQVQIISAYTHETNLTNERHQKQLK